MVQDILNKIKKSMKNKKESSNLKNNSTQTITLKQLIDFLNLNGVSEKELSEATYFACLKILSESVGKLSLKLVSKTENNGVQEQVNHPYYRLCRFRPNRFMTSTTFFTTVELNRNHYGNAYVWLTDKKNREKQELILLPSDKVEVWYDDRKILSEIPNIYYIYKTCGKRYIFTSDEILHFKSFNTFDGIVGISVKEQLKSTISGGITSQTFINEMLVNGFTAKAVLQYTGNLNDASVKTFIENIENYAHGNIDKVKSIIPIPIGASLEPLNIKLADNEFMEIKKYNALQIAAAFGIKPYQINDYSKSSYASTEAQQLDFYIGTLLVILKQYEDELTYKLLTEEEINQGYRFEFNVASILRADLKTQLESLSKGVSTFIYTPNEARAMLGLDSKPGGDKIMGNGTMIPAELVGIQYTKEGSDKNEQRKNEI